MLNKYLKVRAKIKQLEIIRREMEADIIKELDEVGGTYKTRLGTVYTSTRDTWNYDIGVRGKIKKLQTEIANVKLNAQRNQRGKITKKTSVGFRT